MKSSRPDVYVFSPFCLLRPTTNRIFDMRMSDSFAFHGCKVIVIHPYTYMKENISKKDIPKYYGLRKHVFTRMQLLPLFENSPAFIVFILTLIASLFSSIRIALKHFLSGKEAVIISRDAKSLIPAILIKKLTGRMLKIKLIFQAAEIKNTRKYRFVLKNVDGIIAGVTTTKNAIINICKRSPEKFMLSLAPVPVYKDKLTREEARISINYLSNNPLIVYTGKLGLDVNELKYILQTAKLLPDVSFLFTGGRESAVDAIKKYCEELRLQNVIFTGFFDDSTAVRKYQLAADILISYYTSKDHMIEFNYPQKINEYLSTGNPVITPDFPATQDVLTGKNVFFTEPDNPARLAETIKFVLSNPETGKAVAAQAKIDIQPLTFDSKTAEILRFASGL